MDISGLAGQFRGSTLARLVEPHVRPESEDQFLAFRSAADSFTLGYAQNTGLARRCARQTWAASENPHWLRKFSGFRDHGAKQIHSPRSQHVDLCWTVRTALHRTRHGLDEALISEASSEARLVEFASEHLLAR